MCEALLSDPALVDFLPRVVGADGVEPQTEAREKRRQFALRYSHCVRDFLEHSTWLGDLLWIEPGRNHRTGMVIQRCRICRAVDHAREALLVIRGQRKFYGRCGTRNNVGQRTGTWCHHDLA